MKYKYKKGKFIKNGHTMFEEDVLKDLERLAYLEEELQKDKHNVKVERSCQTCKYHESSHEDYPCNKCFMTFNKYECKK